MIPKKTLQKYFEHEKFNKGIDLNKLTDGNYSNYHTQIAFMHYSAGFALNNLLTGDIYK